MKVYEFSGDEEELFFILGDGLNQEGELEESFVKSKKKILWVVLLDDDGFLVKDKEVVFLFEGRSVSMSGNKLVNDYDVGYEGNYIVDFDDLFLMGLIDDYDVEMVLRMEREEDDEDV